jgi:hypothetical protein
MKNITNEVIGQTNINSQIDDKWTIKQNYALL